jgi:hypothetical protein
VSLLPHRHTPTPKPHGPPFPATRSSTSPQEDVQALADALMAVIETAPFDDMLWPEIDRALQHTSHQVKTIFTQRGTLDPPDEPPAARR